MSKLIVIWVDTNGTMVGDTVEDVIQYFQKEGLSYHFLIDKAGMVYLLVDPVRKAFFAGKSSWGTLAFLNTSAIGIGFLNSGFEEYPDDQIQGASKLVAVLCKIYDIDPFITTSKNVNGLDVPFLSIIASGDASTGRAHDVGGKYIFKLAEKLTQCFSTKYLALLFGGASHKKGREKQSYCFSSISRKKYPRLPIHHISQIRMYSTTMISRKIGKIIFSFTLF